MSKQSSKNTSGHYDAQEINEAVGNGNNSNHNAQRDSKTSGNG